MPLSTQPYKGSRDFYPEDKRLQKYIFGVMSIVVESYGYQEYDAPLIEPTELYASKTSDEIVSEQTYTFTDRGGRSVTLRPEITPSVSRMVAAKRQELAFPLRWYSYPVNWRYERPQRGRLREFWQLNVDLFGIAGLEADLEVILIADSIIKAFGAKPEMYSIRLNSRKIIDSYLSDILGLGSEQASTITRLIDRMNKTDFAEFSSQIEAIFTPSQLGSGLPQQLQELLKITDIEKLPESICNHESAIELKKLMKLLSSAGVSNAVFDLSLMRGFNYYTDIVFEIFDNNPDNNRSMFGGGRYDGLVGLFGVEPIPTVGFAMGDVTFLNFITDQKLLPDLKTETDLYIIQIGNVSDSVQEIATELRRKGLNIALGSSEQKLEKQIKSAVKCGIQNAMFIGEKEVSEQQFVLKNLGTGVEKKLGLQQIVSAVKDFRIQ